LGSPVFRLLPLYPEGLGLERTFIFNIAIIVSLIGPTFILLFLLRALFVSRITLIGWLGALAMLIPAILGPVGQLLDAPLDLPTQRSLVFLATCLWFTFYYEVGWRQSAVRGQMRGLHAVLVFHMSATLLQHFAARYAGLTESDNFLLQSIRLLTLLLVTFAMAILMNQRSERLAEEQQGLGRELTAAAEVQSLLLATAAAPGWGCEITSVYLPAGEEGGDFYQVVERADGSRLLLAGDVSGKGLKAAMLVSVAIDALGATKSSSPGQVLASLNESLNGRTGGGFVTCCCLSLSAEGGLTAANAGHIRHGWTGRRSKWRLGFRLAS